MRRFPRCLLPVAIALVAASCAVAPSALADDPHLVVVKATRLPARDWLPWYTRWADHVWLDVKSENGWTRVEWNSHMDSVRVSGISDRLGSADERWGMEVRVIESLRGTAARGVVGRILETAPRFPGRRDYRAWPGPNSNTFVEWLAREVPGLWLELPTTAAGRDYASWVHAGITTTRMGFELETPLAGVQVGLREGVEVHFVGLVAGVGLWPPSIKLPFLPALPFDAARRSKVDE